MVAIPCAAGGHRHYCSNSGSRRAENHTWLCCRFWRDRWTDPRTRAGCRGGDGGYLQFVIAILSPWLLFSPEQLAQPGFKFTAKSLSWAVSGFSNSVIWLIFAAFMFGTGYEKTGLGRRIALFLVKKMGHRTLFLAMR